MTRLLPNRRGRNAVDLAAACTAGFQDDRIRVQIIGEGYNKEQQHQGASDRCPLAPGSVPTSPTLPRPARAPDGHAREGEKQPQYVENNFH